MATKRDLKIFVSFLFSQFELFFWVGALATLAFSSPDGHHYTLCPLSNLGFNYCPGCGLGRSISCVFHGNIVASFEWHPLGVFAIGVIVHRIATLLKSSIKFNHQKLQEL
jgi:hypothetical protein